MIAGFKHLTANPIVKKLKFLPYIIVGIAVFTLNANPDTNAYLQIYTTLLEAKLGIVLIYLLSKKLGQLSKEKHSV